MVASSAAPCVQRCQSESIKVVLEYCTCICAPGRALHICMSALAPDVCTYARPYTCRSTCVLRKHGAWPNASLCISIWVLHLKELE